MHATPRDIAVACLEAAQRDAIPFPEIVATLAAAGFEGYALDYRAASASFHLGDGTVITVPAPRLAHTVAPRFDAAAIADAVRQAQSGAPGYTFAGFCRMVTKAGCAAYVVSFPGRRVLYIGRTAETHVEHFPGSE